MIILLCFDFLGILLAFFVHLCLLLDFSLPSGKIAIVLNIGIGAVLGARLVITRELRQGKDWFWDKGLKGVGPLWLKLVMSLFVTYGIVNCIVSLGAMFSVLSVKMTAEASAIASRKLSIGVFSLIMACYAIEFLLLYLYKVLEDAEQKELKSEGAVWKRNSRAVE